MKKAPCPLVCAFRVAGIRQPIINKFLANGIETLDQLRSCQPSLGWKQVGQTTLDEVRKAREELLERFAGRETFDIAPAAAPAATYESLWTNRSAKYHLYFERYLALGTHEAVGQSVGLSRQRVEQELKKARHGLKEAAEQLIKSQVARLQAGELIVPPSNPTHFVNAWFIAGRDVKELAELGERLGLAEVVKARSKALREQLGAPFPAVQGIDPTALGLTVEDVLHIMAQKPSKRIPGVRVHRSGRVSRTPWSRSDWLRWRMFADGQERPQSTWEAMLPREHGFKPNHKNRSSIWMRWANNDPHIEGRNRKAGRRHAFQGTEDRLRYTLPSTPADLDFLELELSGSCDALLARYAEWERAAPNTNPPRPQPVAVVAPPLAPVPPPSSGLSTEESFREGARFRRAPEAAIEAVQAAVSRTTPRAA